MEIDPARIGSGKLGVMADSHDNVPHVRQAVEIFRRRGVERVVHAGDFVAPFAVLALDGLDCPVDGVLGNNDGEQLGLAQAFEKLGDLHPYLMEREIAGRRVAAVHYPELAEPLAASGHYDLVIYGHSHEVDRRRVGDCLLLNPGEVGGWLSGRSTVAVVDLAELEAEIVELG